MKGIHTTRILRGIQIEIRPSSDPLPELPNDCPIQLKIKRCPHQINTNMDERRKERKKIEKSQKEKEQK